MAERHITIVGAGLAGALLATLLAQRGWTVDAQVRTSEGLGAHGLPTCIGRQGSD